MTRQQRDLLRSLYLKKLSNREIEEEMKRLFLEFEREMVTIQNVIKQLDRKLIGNRKRSVTDYVIVHYDGLDYGYGGIPLAKTIARNSRNSLYEWKRTIPYHIRICKDGQLLQCLDLNDYTFHCHNDTISKKSIAVCVEGLVPNELQLSLLAQVIGWLNDTYKKKLVVKGHREVAGVYTACPGDIILGQMNNFNSILGANTIMANQFAVGDKLKLEYESRNLRAGAGISNPVVKVLQKGDEVYVSAPEVISGGKYNWIKVNFGEGEGWSIDKYWKKTGTVQTESNAQIKEQIINLVKKVRD